MRVVAGAPEGHKADEAEQTPQAAAQTPQTAGQTTRAPQQALGESRGAAPSAEQGPAAADHATAVNGQPSGETPAGEMSSATEHAGQSPAEQAPQTEPPAEHDPATPGFGERGRMRRRARFLRKARELAYRDLGGLVFDLHRFGQRNDPLVLAKLATLREIDTELRGLEDALRDHRPVTVLREVGIAACPRCAAIHSSDDRFCPGCGLAFDANADRPISTAPVTPQTPAVPGPVQPPLATPPATTAQPSTPGPADASGSPAPAPAASVPSLKPTAPPIAAKPTTTPAVAARPSTPPAVEVKPETSPPAAEPRAPERAQEDAPTQILRPPRGNAGA